MAHRGDSLDGHSGWYVESEARCDAAEFPDSVTRPTGVQIWTDARGVRVLTTEVVSFRGAQHCNWEHMTFLVLGGEGPMGNAFVANADPDLDEYFAEPYQENLPLPADAVDSGYRLGDARLWLSPDGMRAYVGTPQRVALWPRTVQLLACA